MPAAKFPSTVYLLHGRGGSPEGTMKKLQDLLQMRYPKTKFFRPLLPHHDFQHSPKKSLEFLQNLKIPQKSLLIGKSFGGLVAAKLQEERPDLFVICLCSPTFSTNFSFKITKKMPHRVSLYSSNDAVIADRIKDWPKLAQSQDISWLTHERIDNHLEELAKIIEKYIFGHESN